MSDLHADTSALRAATGLNDGGRSLVVGVVLELIGGTPLHVVAALFTDRYGGRQDYLDAVQEVRGYPNRHACENAVSNAEFNAEYANSSPRPIEPAQAGAYALLITMPEADFRRSCCSRG